jgi:hypothetical protein
MYSKPTAPRSIGGVLDDSFRLWMPVLKKTWLLILIPNLVSMVLSIPQLSNMAALRPGAIPSLNMGSTIAQLLSLVTGLAFLGFYNAMIARADDTASHGSMSLGQSLSLGYNSWGRAFGIGFIYFVIAIPIAVPLGLAAMSMRGGSSALGMASGAGLMLFAYGLFLVFIFGRIFLAFPVMMLADQGAWDSIKSSWGLTRGHWWRCAAILTVLTIVTYVVFIIAGLVLAAVGLRNGFQAGILSPMALIATQALGAAVGVLFTPLFLAGALSMYYDLRLRKEGGDLAGRVAALATPKP